MEQRKPDPFFEQLEADLREGLEAAKAGELVDADVVWRELGADVQPPEPQR